MKLDQCMPAFMQIDRTTQFGPLWILGTPSAPWRSAIGKLYRAVLHSLSANVFSFGFSAQENAAFDFHDCI